MADRSKSWWQRGVGVPIKAIKGLEQKIHHAIESMIEGLPDTLDSMREGWSPNQTVDLNKKKEKLLRGFVAKDKALLGSDSPYRIGGLLMLARWYQGQYRLSEAHKLYEEAWRLAVLSADLDRVVSTALTVTEFLQLFAKQERAGQVFEEAWGLVEKSTCAWTLQVRLLEAWACFLEGAQKWKDAAAVRCLGAGLIERCQGLTADLLYIWVYRLVSAYRQMGETRLADLRSRHLTCLVALTGAKGSGADSVYRVRDLESLAVVHEALANREAAQSLRAHARFIRIYHKALSDPLPNMREVEEACAFLAARGQSGDESMLLRLKHGAKTKHDRHRERLARR